MATILRFQPRPSNTTSRSFLADNIDHSSGDIEAATDTPSPASDSNSETLPGRGQIVLFTGVRYSRWDDAVRGSAVESIDG